MKYINNSAVSSPMHCFCSSFPLWYSTGPNTDTWFSARGQVFLVKHYLLLIYLYFCCWKFRILCKKPKRYLSLHAKAEEKEKKRPITQQPRNMTTSIMFLLWLSTSQLFSSSWHGQLLIFYSHDFIFHCVFRLTILPTEILMYDFYSTLQSSDMVT